MYVWFCKLKFARLTGAGKHVNGQLLRCPILVQFCKTERELYRETLMIAYSNDKIRSWYIAVQRKHSTQAV